MTLYFSMYSKYWDLIKHHIYHSFKFILSERFSNNLWGSDVLLFSEVLNIVSILFYNFIEFIILLYTFLVTSFSQCKKYVICLISFSKFSDVLLTFPCAKAIGNLWSNWSGVNILSCLRSKTLQSEIFFFFYVYYFFILK